MTIKGNAIQYGDNVDTDAIIPARYLNSSDAEELASHCMEDIDADFAKRMNQGDVIVAGSNFGCGSSREHAPMAIKASGISCVVAKDFARIFYRNSIDIGLPILECPEAVEGCSDGDALGIDFDAGTITNFTKGKVYRTFPFPDFLKNIISAGGLMEAMKAGLLG